MLIPRSLLFVPADATEKIAKAHEREADAIILDLEDGVAAASKPRARVALAAGADALADKGAVVYVRINSGARSELDLEVCIRASIAMVLAPKCEDAAAVTALSQAIGERERAQGLAVGAVGICAMIESPLGLRRIDSIAQAERVRALALGPEDYCAALGAAPSRESLAFPCQMLSVAGAAYGRASYGLPLSITAYRDREVLDEAAQWAHATGLSGALCVHPTQVEAVNAAFAPRQEEIREAELVVAHWERLGGDAGASVLNGRMIDRPVVERARRLLRSIRRDGRSDLPRAQ